MRHLLEAALKLRRPLASAETDALRLVDGAGDGLPGLVIEDFAGRWLLSTTGPVVPAELRDWLDASGRACGWKRLDRHERESPVPLGGPVADEPFLIRENGLAFEISFQSGYSQGIFLDQRERRLELRARVAPGRRVLNTFAYTGAFSVAAAAAGAETTTLDLSQPYLDWARRNFSHNQLDPAAHHFCKGDTFHWLRRFARQGRRFDLIVLDPPTFSRDDRGRVFRVERDYADLVSLAAGALAPGGELLCSTNCRKLSPAAFRRQILEALGPRTDFEARPMPPDFRDEAYLKTAWVRPA